MAKTKKAKCPNCGAGIKWDWDMDCYAYDHGEYLNDDTGRIGNNDITIHTCKCGQLLGMMVVNDEGATPYNHPELEDVDWQEEINSNN